MYVRYEWDPLAYIMSKLPVENVSRKRGLLGNTFLKTNSLTGIGIKVRIIFIIFIFGYFPKTVAILPYHISFLVQFKWRLK